MLLNSSLMHDHSVFTHASFLARGIFFIKFVIPCTLDFRRLTLVGWVVDHRTVVQRNSPIRQAPHSSIDTYSLYRRLAICDTILYSVVFLAHQNVGIPFQSLGTVSGAPVGMRELQLSFVNPRTPDFRSLDLAEVRCCSLHIYQRTNPTS